MIALKIVSVLTLLSPISASVAPDMSQLIHVVWRSAETDFKDVLTPFSYTSSSELIMTSEGVNKAISPKSLPSTAIPSINFIFEEGVCLRAVVGESLVDVVFAQSGNERLRGMIRLEPGTPSSFCVSDGTEISLWNSASHESLGLDVSQARHLAIDYWAVITVRVNNLPINESLIQRNVEVRLSTIAHWRKLAENAAQRSLKGLISHALLQEGMEQDDVVRAASEAAVAAALAIEDGQAFTEQFLRRPASDAEFRQSYVKLDSLSLKVTRAALRLVDSLTKRMLPGFGNAKLRVSLEAGVFLRSLSMRD